MDEQDIQPDGGSNEENTSVQESVADNLGGYKQEEDTKAKSISEVLETEEGQHTPEIKECYNLRGNRERNCDHRLDHQMDSAPNTSNYHEDFQMLQHAVDVVSSESNNDTCRHLAGYMMTQMTATEGITKHGQVAIDAMFKEFFQIDDKSVFKGVDPGELTHGQRKGALWAVNLIKEKRCGKIKGRTCANGRPQQNLYTKEETNSPTVSIDALMMSLMIDALERRDAATADVEGAYLHANMEHFTVLKLTGEAVDIMCKVNTEHKKFVAINHGRKVLYLQLLKALYGCVKSALLWYELFMGTLEDMGFKLNPYNPCVANKMINRKQCTTAWYIDNNKISHVDENAVTTVIEKIEERFGKMTVTRGKRHIFLGMDIIFNNEGTVTINMKDYIKEAIEAFGDDVSKPVATPAQKTLFDINVGSKELGTQARELFHSIVTKLLYMSKRGRIDIQLGVALLCTRVSCSIEQDWEKLKRILQYLNGSLDKYLVIGANSLTVLKTWVDAAYGVHHNMKSHTGGAMSLGRGAILRKSAKQKLNTKSSTEAELVGANDYLPNTIWAQMFLEEQGYVIKENSFAEDDQSAMKMEKNGRASCGQKFRHIDICFFLIKDRIKTEGIDIVYCPTEEMLADFFTKPLQGNLFRKFKKVLMGHKRISSIKKEAQSTPSEEHVGNPVSTTVNEKSLVEDGQTGRASGKRKDTYASVVKRNGSSKR